MTTITENSQVDLTCEICGKPAVGAVFFDTVTISGTPEQPSVIASGRHAHCADHKPAVAPGLVLIPCKLLSDPNADAIDLSERLVCCELRYDSEHKSDASLTLTYQIDLTTHQGDRDRVALGRT